MSFEISMTILTSPMEKRLEKSWATALDLASRAALSDYQIGLLALARVSSWGQELRVFAKEQRLAVQMGYWMAVVESNRNESMVGRRRVSEVHVE